MSLYKVLGLGPAASKDEVRAAYKRQALAAHPDKGGSKESFHAVARAFETLYNDAARSCYDGRLAGSASAARERPGPPRGAPAPATGPPAPTCATAASGPRPPPSGAGGGPAARPPSAAATAASADGARVRQTTGGPREGAARTPTGGSPPSGPSGPVPAEARDGARRGPGRPKGWRKQGCKRSRSSLERLSLDEVLERLEGVLRRLSPETRRHILGARLAPAQRLALEQWMVAQRAARAAAPEQGAQGAPAGSARAEADAGSSSSSEGDEVSDSSGGDSARLALEDLPRDAADEVRGGAGVLGEGAAGADEGDQEEEEGEADKESMKFPCLKRNKLVGGSYSYQVRMCIYSIVFHTKAVKDLAAAIDFQVVLMTIRERMPPLETAEASSIESVVSGVLGEQGPHVKRGMKLGVGLIFNVGFLLGRKTLHLPALPCSRIREVMSLWEQAVKRFWKSNKAFCSGSAAPGGLFHIYDPDTLREMWLAIRQCCVALHGWKGHDEADVVARLDAQYAGQAPFFERRLEAWNTYRMRVEDLGFRRRDPEATLQYRERYRQRLRERHAMAEEDGCSERTRLLNREWRLIEQVEACVCRLRRIEAASEWRRRVEEAAGTKRRRKEEALERAARRSQRAEREARWRAMRRKDLTVGELLRGPSGAPD